MRLITHGGYRLFRKMKHTTTSFPMYRFLYVWILTVTGLQWLVLSLFREESPDFVAVPVERLHHSSKQLAPSKRYSCVVSSYQYHKWKSRIGLAVPHSSTISIPLVLFLVGKLRLVVPEPSWVRCKNILTPFVCAMRHIGICPPL